MNDFLMPYSLQLTSVVGETGLVLVPNQRSVQAPAGNQHWFPKPGVYMLVLTWNGVERATLTTYSNGVWRNPIQIPAGTGQRTSAPHIYSGIGASLRFGIVLDKPATTAENLAVVTVIPQETFKPSGGGVVSGRFCRLLVTWWGGGKHERPRIHDAVFSPLHPRGGHRLFHDPYRVSKLYRDRIPKAVGSTRDFHCTADMGWPRTCPGSVRAKGNQCDVATNYCPLGWHFGPATLRGGRGKHRHRCMGSGQGSFSHLHQHNRKRLPCRTDSYSHVTQAVVA